MAILAPATAAKAQAPEARPLAPASPTGPILNPNGGATPPPGIAPKRIQISEDVPPAPSFAAPKLPAAPAALKLSSPVPVADTPISKPTEPTSPEANVTLEMTGPETGVVGTPVTYEILVRNHGRSPVYQVRVEDEMPSGVRFVSGDPTPDIPSDRMVWNLGILDGGAEKRLKFTIVSANEGEVPSAASVSFSASCAVRTKFTRPKLAVTVTGPESVAVGEPVVFQIQLTNTGSGPITRVLLRDRLPGGLQHPQGNLIEAELPGLGMGESKTVTLRTLAVKGGVLSNEIEALAECAGAPIQLTGGIRNPDLNIVAKAQVRVLEPDLAVKISGPKSCMVKCESIFTIDVMNPGTGPTGNVKIIDHLPEGLDFLAASDDGRYDLTTKSITWSISRLDSGAHRVVTVQMRGAATAESTNSVVAQAEGNLIARAQLPVHVEGVPAVALEVSALDDPAPVNSDANYEIRVLNRGSCPCTGIQIMASLPEGVEMREVQAPVPYQSAGQQIQFAPYSKLLARADVVYRIKVRAKVPGDLRFRVQLTCEQLQQPVFKEESSRFFKPQ
jgi:uncharacterized repeat protein (TIGR01451 family)